MVGRPQKCSPLQLRRSVSFSLLLPIMLLQYLTFLPLVFGSPLIQDRQADAEALTYEGHQAFEVNTKGNTEEVLAALSSVDYDRWGAVEGDHIDIALAPEEISKFKGLGLDWVEKIKDIGELVKNEKIAKWNSRKRLDGLPHDSWFDAYHNYDDHIKFVSLPSLDSTLDST